MTRRNSLEIFPVNPTSSFILFLVFSLQLAQLHLALGEIPRQSADALSQTASHHFTGTTVQVYQHVVTHGDYLRTLSVAEIDVDQVLKGTEIKGGDRVYVRYWGKKYQGAGHPPPGHYGHWDPPTTKDRVEVFVKGDRTTGYDVLSPNGFYKRKKDEPPLGKGEISFPLLPRELGAARQVLYVRSDSLRSYEAKVYCLERQKDNDISPQRKEGERWTVVKGVMPAVVGRNGIAHADEKREGDGCTPSGVFPLRLAFGYAPTMLTGLDYRQATSESLWIDDPHSYDYNQWVEGKSLATSFERMRRDDDQYKIGAVIEYNTEPIVPGRGSAIFLHLWDDRAGSTGKIAPTAGCVALAERDLSDILRWLDRRQQPVIWITADGPPLHHVMKSPMEFAMPVAFLEDVNPFLAPSVLPLETPDFSAIRPEHYLPGFEAGMREQLLQVEAITNDPAKPNFENTLVAMERSGAILRRVQAVFFNMTNAHTTPQLQQIEEEIAPRLAAHSDNIYLNKRLFARVEALWNARTELSLNEEQNQLLKKQYETFIRAGARLTDEQQTRIRAINEELSTLTTQFQNSLLALFKERAVVVKDVQELDGLSMGEIAAAREAAEARGLTDQYLLPIVNTTRQPVLVSLKNRTTRQRVWEASARRGLGENGGIDNRPLVLKLAKLRAERAKILGYASHAAYTLEDQMAKTPAAALKMLRDLVPAVTQKTRNEAMEIQQRMLAAGIAGELQPWDWEHFAEQVRAQKFSIDENQIKPYFELDSVLKNGAFYAMNKLYGVEFQERKDLPVYEPTVRVFDVFENGKRIGLFYADYYQRDSKNGGAWMDAYVSQSRLLQQLPVVVNVMNIPRPAAGEPTLLTFDLVQTMFHELGHGLHGLFSSVEYPTLSGTSVPRDFVEFPSTFHEDWAIDPVVLRNYARHHKTGEPIPLEMLKKSIAASKFGKAFDTQEYLAAALLDLRWHSLTMEEVPVQVESFEALALAADGVAYGPIPPRYRSQYFAHIFSGGYSAGYYAYLWSEVLAADAFAAMQNSGGLTRENGQRFREEILQRGGAREVELQYRNFRKQDATVDALLARRGLK
jgi:peptidyl-dipeptidase Dcp